MSDDKKGREIEEKENDGDFIIGYSAFEIRYFLMVGKKNRTEDGRRETEEKVK